MEDKVSIFISKKSGGLYSLELSTRVVKLFLLLVFTMVVAIVFLSYFYLSTLTELSKLEEDVLKLSSKVALLESSLNNHWQGGMEPREEQEEYSQKAELGNFTLEEVDKGFVKVSDIKKNLKNGRLKVSFWLYNLKKGEKTSGYLFAAVLNQHNMAYFYPLGSNFLLKGFELYKDGIYFSIYYRRLIKIILDGFEGLPKKLIVCVYNENGEKILQKTYDL